MNDSSSLTIKDSVLQLAQQQMPILTDLNQLKRFVQRTDVAIQDIAKLTRFDPVFNYYILAFSARKFANKAGELTSAEQAMSMLGVTVISEFIREFKFSSNDWSDDWWQVVAESCIAGKIAEKLAAFKNGPSAEAITAAQLARINEWCIFAAHPRRSWQWRRMLYRKPFSQNNIGDALLGFMLPELQEAVVEAAQLAPIHHRVARHNAGAVVRDMVKVVRLYRVNELKLEECSRELRFTLSAPEALPLIANQLAIGLCSPWLRNHLGRWIDIAAIHCHKKSKEISSLLISVISGLDDQLLNRMNYLPHALFQEYMATPYQSFLVNKEAVKQKILDSVSVQLEHSQTLKVRSNTAPLVEDSKEGTYVSSPERIEATYDASQKTHLHLLRKKLIESPEALPDIKSTIIYALTAMVKQTPIERMSFMPIDKTGQLAKSAFSIVKAKAEKGPLIQIEFSRSPVFSKFMTQPTFLYCDKSKHQKIWPQLPLSIQDDLRVKGFLINSMRYGGKVRGFLYADMALSGNRFNQDLQVDFKHIAAALASALKFHMKNKQ